MVIGITGTNGAGKGTVVEYLEKKGFKHYSVREYLEERLREQELPVDRPHLGQMGDHLRQEHGAGFFIEHFSKEMQANGQEDATIESIRSVGEAKALKDRGGFLLAVDADRKLRFERIRKRRSGTDDLDFDTFAAQEENEWRASSDEGMNVPAVMALADHTIYNDNDTEALFREVEAAVEKFRSA